MSMQLASTEDIEHKCEELSSQLATAVEGRERLKKALGELRAKHKEAVAKASEHGDTAALLNEKRNLLEK